MLIFQIILGALLGACLGSYIGCAWWRVPRGISMMGHSECPSCGTPVPTYLNIPVISFLMLRGKSRCCKQPLSPKYLVAEVFTVIIGGVIGAFIPAIWMGIVVVVLVIIAPLIIGIFVRKPVETTASSDNS